MRNILLRIIRVIDSLTSFTGYLVALLMAPLILANVYEVVARYYFRAPTSWALDVTVMSSSTIFMVGAAYALLRGAHIRTDMFWEAFSDRTKGIIDATAYLFLFLPTMVVLFYISWDDFLYSFEIGERSTMSLWQPPTWPLRAVVPLAAALLFVQGISEMLKSLYAARTGIALIQHEKIEV